MRAQRSQGHTTRIGGQQILDIGRIGVVSKGRDVEDDDLHQNGTKLAEGGGEAVEGAAEFCWEDFGWDLEVVSGSRRSINVELVLAMDLR